MWECLIGPSPLLSMDEPELYRGQEGGGAERGDLGLSLLNVLFLLCLLGTTIFKPP